MWETKNLQSGRCIKARGRVDMYVHETWVKSSLPVFILALISIRTCIVLVMHRESGRPDDLQA